MIRRFFALILMSFIGIATAIVPATAQTQSMGHNVAGTWKVSATGAHFQNGSYAIQQVNQNIIGKNSAGGQLQGTMKDPSTVQGTWRGPSGETGWFNMHLTPDGKSFSGQYGYGGRKPTGTLIGQKVAKAM
jgi:hypothetical protein